MGGNAGHDGRRGARLERDIGDLEITARVLWGFSHGLIQIAMTKAQVLARAGIAVPQLTQQAMDLLMFSLTGKKP